nr:recombinase family protein [Lachnospiraceae bacterium]
LLHSLSAQISYYNDLIQKNPEWEYAGVYADEGISGTSIKNRHEFKRLIKDCEDGKIDLILVKSVSRFARDTVDTLNATRHLKDLGVDVFFEKEGIHSISGEGELMLTLLASFAQAEAESTSSNLKWAYRKSFENGETFLRLSAYGYDWDHEIKHFSVNEEEAVWVRYIFNSYLSGNSMEELVRDLKKKGVLRKNGQPLTIACVKTILTSEKCVGDLLFQKYYSPKINHCRINRGEVEQYLVSDAHEAIVSRETFSAVQKRLRYRGVYGFDCDSENAYFAGMVTCGYCGSPCTYTRMHGQNTKTAEMRCKKMHLYHECDLLPIKELELKDIVMKEIGEKDKVEHITLYDDHIDFTLKEGQVQTHQREFPKEAYNQTPFTGRIRCGNCGGNVVTKSKNGRPFSTCNNRLYDKTSCDCHRINYADLKRGAAEVLGTTENLDDLIYTKIKKTLLYKDRIEFYMRGGVKTWQRP